MFSCAKTRECRANNFLGISHSLTYAWENIDVTKSVPNRVSNKSYPGFDDLLGDMLTIFIGFQDGMNAALWRLATYFKAGNNTPEGIYNEWSGDTEELATTQNRVTKGTSIARMMACNPDEKLEFNLNDIKDLIQAMLRYEDSTKIFESDLINIPDEMYQEAINYALRKVNGAVPLAGNKIKEKIMASSIEEAISGLSAGSSQPTQPGPAIQGQANQAMANQGYATQAANYPNVVFVQTPKAPPVMNPDAIFAFATAIVGAAGSVAIADPKIAIGVQLVSAILAAIGSVLHLDGK